MAKIDTAFRVEGLSLEDKVLIIVTDDHPSSSEVEAPIGSLILDTNGELHVKTDQNDQDWTQIEKTGHTHSASAITSGTFDDDRISESSVTQHQGALSIDADNIDSGTLSTSRLPTITTDEVDFTDQALSSTDDVEFNSITQDGNSVLDSSDKLRIYDEDGNELTY